MFKYEGKTFNIRIKDTKSIRKSIIGCSYNGEINEEKFQEFMKEMNETITICAGQILNRANFNKERESCMVNKS